MRIVCPSCAATYEVADAMLARPRTVRCSRCAREWVQDSVSSLTASELPTIAPETPAIPEPVKPPPTPVPVLVPQPVAEPVAVVLPRPGADRTGARLKLAWMASVLLLLLLVFLAYRYRVEIQAAWPPSTRLFRLLPN